MGLLDGFKKSNPMSSNDTGNVISNLEFTGFGRTGREVAEKLVALSSGVSHISETIASLPVIKYRVVDGNKQKVKEPINYLLNRSCDGILSGFELKDMILKSMIYNGNGYVLIKRNSKFEIEKLVPLRYEEVSLQKVFETDNYRYSVSKENYQGTYEHYEIINLIQNSNGTPEGKGVLEIGREVIGVAQAQNKFLGATLTNGSFLKGLITTNSSLSPEQRESLSKKIRQFFSGGNSGRVLVLGDDMKYQNISLSPADVELLKNQEFSILEIARLLKMSPSKLGVREKSSYNSLEMSNLEFMQYTLMPHIKRFEEALNWYCLSEDEKKSGEYYFEFDISALLKADKDSEKNYYTSLADAGIISLNEVREKLNLPKEEGLDIFTLGKFNSIIQEGKVVNIVSGTNVDEKNNIDTNSVTEK